MTDNPPAIIPPSEVVAPTPDEPITINWDAIRLPPDTTLLGMTTSAYFGNPVLRTLDTSEPALRVATRVEREITLSGDLCSNFVLPGSRWLIWLKNFTFCDQCGELVAWSWRLPWTTKRHTVKDPCFCGVSRESDADA